MTSTHPIDRQKLAQFISSNVEYVTNPQTFRYQMNVEIANSLKQHEDQLKLMQSKMRTKMIQEKRVKERQDLRLRLQQKAKKGTDIKEKIIGEKVKNMTAIRKQKEQFVAQKLAQSRKQHLKESLKKIQQYQQQSKEMQNNRLIKAQSESKMHKLDESRIKRKIQWEAAQYQETVLKLKEKGIFDLPNRQKINDLYSKKAKHMKQQKEKKEDNTVQKMGQSLMKIEQARKRKETILQQRVKKLKLIEELQTQSKRNKFKQIMQKERTWKQQLQNKHASKMKHAHTFTNNQSAKMHHVSAIHQRDSQNEYYRHQQHRQREGSYKNQIRRQIDLFMKKQGIK